MDKILDKLGFSEYKKRAYTALVKLEKASAMQVAKRANIPSSKIYSILNWLYENGYISMTKQHPLEYKANDPKSILASDVKTKISELKEVEREISKISTNLGVTKRADFQIIYGRNSFFKKVKEAVSKSNHSIIAIVKSWRIDYELKELTSEFIKRGGVTRFLGPITNKNKKLVAEWKKLGVNIKNFTPETTRFTVWDAKTIAIGFKDNKENDYFSIWIENEHLGKIFTEYFDSLWKKM